MTEYQNDPLLPIEQEDEDLITKEKIESEALQEINNYSDPLMCLITARMMKNKADKMAEYIMSKAIDALKVKKGKYQWMGVNVSLVKPKILGWQVKTLEDFLSSQFHLSDEVELTDEMQQKITEYTEGYEKDTAELLAIENALFELEMKRDKEITEIQKKYEIEIATAKRAVEEKKYDLIKEGKADVQMGVESLMVKFPS